jgi:hypothetical protein
MMDSASARVKVAPASAFSINAVLLVMSSAKGKITALLEPRVSSKLECFARPRILTPVHSTIVAQHGDRVTVA